MRSQLFSKSIFILSIALLTLLSCSKNETVVPEKVISVNVQEAERAVNANLLINTDTAALYRLPNNPIIGNIEKIKEADGILYILDEQRQSIFKYNPATDELVCFNRFGQGPDEYTFITDYFISDGNMYLLDHYTGKVNVYNSDGQCIRRLPVNDEVWANALFVLDEYIFLINQSSETSIGRYHIARISPDGAIKTFLPFDKDLGITSEDPYAVGDGFAYYVEAADNIIYKITKDDVTPCYYVDFGNEKMPEKYYSSGLYELMSKGIDKEYSTGVNKIKYGDGLLFMYFRIKNTHYKLVYDTNTDQTLAFCEGFLLDDGKLYGFSPTIKDVCGDEVYCCVSPNEIEFAYPGLKVDELSEPYKSQIIKIHDELNLDDDNPYIFKYWLKNFAK